MASTEAQKRASIKWQKENMHRIPLDVKNDYYENILKPAVKATGMTMGAFIKGAIQEKLDAGPADLNLPPDVLEEMKQAAADRGMTLEELISEAVRIFLKEY